MENGSFWEDNAFPSQDEESSDNSSEISSEIENLLYSHLHHDSTNSKLNLDPVLSTEIVPSSQYISVSQTIPSEVSSVDILKGFTCDLEHAENRIENMVIKEAEILPENSEKCIIINENYSGLSRNAEVTFKEINTKNLDNINKTNTNSVVRKKCKRSELSDDLTILPKNKKKKNEMLKRKTKSNNGGSSKKRKTNSKDDRQKIKKRKIEVEDSLPTVNELLNLYKAQMEKYYNSECDNITINLQDDEQSGDLWHLDPEDRYINKRTYRFFNKLAFVTCNNCKNKGHLSRDCDQPRKIPQCYLCGAEGHNGEQCINAMCAKCWLPGHFIEHCLWRDKDLQKKCPRCSMFGHLREECPDLWRRYHLTTKSDTIISSPDHQYNKKKAYCYNCGRRGHFGHECTRKRMDFYSFPTTPFVISYSDPSPVDEKDKSDKERMFIKLHNRKKAFGEKSNKEFSRFTTRVKNKKKRLKKLREKLNGFVEKIDLCSPKKQKIIKAKLKSKTLERENSSEQIPCSIPSTVKKKRKRKRKKTGKFLNINEITTNVISHCSRIINKYPNGKLANKLKQKNMKQKGVLMALNGNIKNKKPLKMVNPEAEVIVLSD